MATKQSDLVPQPLKRAGLWSAYFLLAAAGVLALLYLVVRLKIIFIPVFVALLITTLLAPLVARLRDRGWKPFLATWTILLGMLLLLAGVVAVLVPQFTGQFDDMRTSAAEGFDEVVKWLGEGPLEVSEQDLDRYLEQAAERVQENSDQITGGVLAGVTVTFEVLAGILLVFVLVFFFLKDGAEIWDWIKRQAARRNRDHVDEMGRRAWSTLTGYVRGTAVIALVDAVLIGIVLLVVGNPLWLPLAVITFFGAFFPIVGAVVAGVLAALVTLVTNGFTPALIVGGAIILIQQLEGDVLQPLVMGKAVRLHPLVVIVALTGGGILGGIAGAFVAVPVTAVGASVGNYLKGQLRSEEDRTKQDRAAGKAIDKES
ncbi:MAG: AI-2E family transporter [Actinomycetota bacterium]